jgi:hypothetical protein
MAYISIMTNLRDKTFYKPEAVPFVIFVLLEMYYFLRGYIKIPLVGTVNRQTAGRPRGPRLDF